MAPDIARLESALFRVVRSIAGLRPSAAGDTCDKAALAVLSVLEECGPARLSELAGAIGLDPSTVSRHVRHLEEGGLLARHGDPSDGRAHQLLATSAGVAVLAAARGARQRILNAALADWPPGDRDLLGALLTRLAAELAAGSGRVTR